MTSQRDQPEGASETQGLVHSRPMDQPDGITFEKLFDPAAIQRVQDDFAAATGVASIITRPDGTPITRPSNFCRLCEDIIRCTEKGLLNCVHSDAMLGSQHPEGPLIQPCLSGGLWDAGTSITVGDRHVANWLIGQVRDETQSEEKMRDYARAIGADEEDVVQAFREVPAMSLARFKKIAQALFTLANQLSTIAYQNVQQTRFITERKEAEENYRTLFREMLDGFALHEIICDEKGTPADYRFLAVNPAFERLTGLKAEELVGRTVLEALPNIERRWIEVYGKVALTGEPACFEDYAAELKKYYEVTAFRPAPNQFACIFSDITGRKRAEQEKAKLEADLQQAQTMESVGRLAGGVAHDFNNMLGVILGNLEMVIAQVDPAQPFHADLMEIRKAAMRSSDLTRQLLAFARKQTVAPKVLDLNETVAGMLKLLKRIVGENIDLIWQPKASLWLVKVDPSQIDQILANLCVNARDAIADVGKITIETENVTFDDAYCASHAEVVAGEYVRLAVSDDGRGMDKETLSHLFEPFFTTKGMGRGTGLGLATIYGILKQNKGCINVYGEPGQGTTFKIYLPRHVGPTLPAEPEGAPLPALHRHETILLVEDEPALLKMTTRMLASHGYTVLAAETPGEAIRLAREHAGEIHLLLTDVVMPEMNGRDLAKKLLALYPHFKRLFMSGYTANVIVSHGVMDEGARVHFLQKPFTIKELTDKVRAALDEK